MQAVIIDLVRIAVTLGEARVQRRLVLLRPEVVAQAVIDRRVGERIEGVLHEQGVVGIFEIGGRVIQVAGRIVVIGQLVDLAGRKIGLAVEVVETIGRLDEQVVDTDLLALVTALDRMAAHAIGADERGTVVGRLQDVGLTELVRTEVDDRITRSTAGQRTDGRRIRTDLDAGEALAFRRHLTALIVTPGETRFGRELVGPLGVQLDSVVVFVFRLGVPVGVEIGRGVGGGRTLPQERIGVTVGRRQALTVHDVPVDLDRVLFVLEIGRQRDRTRVQLRRSGIGRPWRQHAVEVGLSEWRTRGMGRRIDPDEAGAEARARRAGLDDRGRGVLFVGGGEEQGVLQDRAREEEAVVFVRDEQVQTRGHARVGVIQAVVVPGLVTDVVKSRTVEAVGTRTQDQVQGAAGEIAFFDVRRHGLDGHLFDGFQRDRAEIGRQATGVQAEIVARLDAVDGDAVGARRGAGDIETARRTGAAGVRVELGQRVTARRFADVALVGDDVLDGFVVETRARTGVRQGQVTLARNDDDLAVRSFHGDVELFLAAQRQVDVRRAAVLQARARDIDFVGAADLQAADFVLALRVRLGDVAGTRRRVDDRHDRAGDRLARRVGDDAAQARSGLLRIDGRRRSRQQSHCRGPDHVPVEHI